MRILLVGEYSRLHNSLKAGLEALGHQVTLTGTGDAFKNYPVDISFAPTHTRKQPFFRFLKRVVYKITKINLEETEAGLRFWHILPQLKNYDVVQLINSNALETHPSWSRFLLRRLFRQNTNVFLLVCGDETPVVDYLLKRELKYDILTPYYGTPEFQKKSAFSLKYTTKAYRKLFAFVEANCRGILVSDIDYKLAMERMGYQITHIPNPVVTEKISPEITVPTNKIIVFLGINRFSSVKKGVPFFEAALEVIQRKFPERVDIRIVESVPYNEYVQLYTPAHILLDMVYAYDQGYNALEAMAHGKVVFTGAEQEFLGHYNVKEDDVCINALPDVDYLVNKLSMLIETPEEIKRIGENARAFIEREHQYIKVAEKYLKRWTKM